MRIGVNCFKDKEIYSIISSGGIIGTCDITGQKNVPVYDTEETNQVADLGAYLSEILDVYTPESELPVNFPKENLAAIEEILARDWSVFHISENKIKIIVMEICKNTYPAESLIFCEKVGIEKLCDADFLRRNCIVKDYSWEFFMSSIKSRNRFHSNHINLELLEELFGSAGLQRRITKNKKVFYRARIGTEEGYSLDKMGPPPSNLASAGRANSQGIRCLYLASDIATTLHEIRARDLDYITIGFFVPKRDIRIVDLSNLDEISPFAANTFDYEWFAINMNILKKISEEIAKPLRRQDSELDYLPAQYIADFVKSLGYDGICYRSTLNISGLNYAIFNYEKFECKKVEVYYINSLVYKTNPGIEAGI